MLITEARIPSGRVDLLLIDFDANRVEVWDVTSLDYARHTDKTAAYKKDLSKLLGMPVDAMEFRYVGTDGALLERLIEVMEE